MTKEADSDPEPEQVNKPINKLFA